MNLPLLDRIFYITMSAVATCLISGSPMWIAPVAAVVTTALHAAASLAAEIMWQPYRDADRMRKGVCPRCSTYNSLHEVTSADPHSRAVDCMACESRFAVRQKGDRLVAEYLGERSEIG